MAVAATMRTAKGSVCSWCGLRPVAPNPPGQASGFIGVGALCAMCDALPFSRGGARFVIRPRFRDDVHQRGHYVRELVDRAYGHKTVASGETDGYKRAQTQRDANRRDSLLRARLPLTKAADPETRSSA